jgi:hypothetical protein
MTTTDYEQGYRAAQRQALEAAEANTRRGESDRIVMAHKIALALPVPPAVEEIEGIVPPYLNDDWRLMRSHLQRAVEFTAAAAEASTVEDVRRNGSAAQAALMDADFTLRRIERNHRD